MKKRITTWVLLLMLITAEICPAKIQGAVQPAPEISAPGAVLMEPSTGTVLYEKNGEEQRSPASITKIMTLLLIFEALEDGQITLEEEVVTSAYAKSMGGSQVFLEEGEKQTVETLIKCIVVASGNDASVVMAEHLAGSEEEFVKRMNEKAGELGMLHTQFEDCCGLTDSEEHYTTASDVAIVSRELITRFPRILEYSSIWMENIIHRTAQGEKEFCLTNTNKLIRSYEGCVGLKTGSTSVAKYCVSAVAQRGEMTLLAVVMGAPDAKVRFKDAAALLDYGFGKCNLYLDENRKNPDPVPIKGGVKAEVSCRYTGEFRYLDTEGKNLSQIEKKIVYMKNLQAPVKKGDIVGEAQYLLDGKVIGKTDIVAAKSVKKAGLWDYIKHIRKRMIKGDDYSADR
ncbi:D-alanyl-D-alanine carboxypeptidase [Oliverpabstia sp. DFI.9.49]|nr:D-alanyl-D-alanine carboxypeptidase [Blautia sp. DFI.9.9]MCG5646457.1 D-alanyl-D-alanine carboxypeptidase [Oliverpabstia sp. DFI.9.49]